MVQDYVPKRKNKCIPKKVWVMLSGRFKKMVYPHQKQLKNMVLLKKHWDDGLGNPFQEIFNKHVAKCTLHTFRRGMVCNAYFSFSKIL